ncbi:MAG: cysteine desulfurase NifS [Desulfotomaculaceae bacterium]|nr:cysteine desulfurase NifS [Desulfotomaculaceae bacterium]
MGRIYFDHSATTPVHPDVAEEMLRYLTGKFGNPSSLHFFGREAKKAIEEAREKVAENIGAKNEEVVFTSGGTEADHLAIKGAVYANRKKGNHIITSAVEHHAVLDTCKSLEKEGCEVTVLPVDGYGMVNPQEVANAIKDNTIFITIMHANNEVGTIQPISEIGSIAREKNILFHTDAVQSMGKIPVDVGDLKVDLLSISGHKIYAPKGIGALYIRQGINWRPYNYGGGQERKHRPGTENVPGIVAMGKAVELAASEMEKENARLTILRDKLIKGITERISHVRLTGHPVTRLPNNANFAFEFVDGSAMLLNLDMHGVAASSGSACTSGTVSASHVLLAMGIPHQIAYGSLRLTLGRSNTDKDVEKFLELMPQIIERLRSRVS